MVLDNGSASSSKGARTYSVAQPIFPTMTIKASTLTTSNQTEPWAAITTPEPITAAMINHTTIANKNFMGGIVGQFGRRASYQRSGFGFGELKFRRLSREIDSEVLLHSSFPGLVISASRSYLGFL